MSHTHLYVSTSVSLGNKACGRIGWINQSWGTHTCSSSCKHTHTRTQWASDAWGRSTVHLATGLQQKWKWCMGWEKETKVCVCVCIIASFIHDCRTEGIKKGKGPWKNTNTHAECRSVTCCSKLILLYSTECGSIGISSFSRAPDVAIIICFPIQWTVGQSAVVCSCNSFHLQLEIAVELGFI